MYDYKFDKAWENPDSDVAKLKGYRAILTPDFSMYLEMAPAMQLYNTFRNRWCGAYFASKGIRVIPTISWGDENTFEFCFQGVEKGATVAVSTFMSSESAHHKDQKAFFLKGYTELLRQIEPERIICYNKPFSEMMGNIVYVDYELSSWRYMHKTHTKHISNAYILPEKTGIFTVKRGQVEAFKGSGSAYGGEWKPTKELDKRLIGAPGEIKRVGYYETKIGPDGRAEKERHNTDHGKPWAHTNPHDHFFDWSEGKPNPISTENYPDGAPEFKRFGGTIKMLRKNTPEENRFVTIDDFKWCMHCGGEVNFIWNGKMYGAFGKISNPKNSEVEINIGECYYLKDGAAYNPVSHEPCLDIYGEFYKTPDEALEYLIDGVRLRDIITDVEVTDRTI